MERCTLLFGLCSKKVSFSPEMVNATISGVETFVDAVLLELEEDVSIEVGSICHDLG